LKVRILGSFLVSSVRLNTLIIQIAQLKKQEAIMADITAHEERVSKLLLLSTELESENYHQKDPIVERAGQIEERWDRLNRDLAVQRKKLLMALRIQKFVFFQTVTETDRKSVV